MRTTPWLHLVYSPLAACLLLGTHLQAQSAERVPLTSADVSAVLHQSGFLSKPEDIQLPEDLRTATDQPGLHLTQVDTLADGRLRVRFACRAQVECQPFAAVVRLSTEKLEKPAVLQASPGTAPAHATTPQGRHTLLRPGQQVTLLMEDDHMRISLPVLVIDSGALHEQIRLSSLDRKTTFHAVVLNGDTVRGALP